MGNISSIQKDDCPICETKLHTFENQNIYDGVCAWFCPNCDYYEIRARFYDYKDLIIESLNKIRSRDNAD